jgi:hypothetical protein
VDLALWLYTAALGGAGWLRPRGFVKLAAHCAAVEALLANNIKFTGLTQNLGQL